MPSQLIKICIFIIPHIKLVPRLGMSLVCGMISVLVRRTKGEV